MQLILASQSAARRAMLAQAGLAFEAVSPNVDEDAAKAALAGSKARDLADALAELKTVKVSAGRPEALVIGSDSVVELNDGRLLDKPRDRDEAAAHLRMLAGRRHYLHSAAVLAQEGRAIWRHVDRATMHVRPLSDAFIDAYLDADWEQARWSVGVYRVEGPGAQLFEQVDGSHFTVMGLPLLPLLAQLRVLGAMAS